MQSDPFIAKNMRFFAIEEKELRINCKVAILGPAICCLFAIIRH